MDTSLARRLGAEFVGTALLLATVVGSGIMAERLAAGNAAVALLANALATGGGLFVLITLFAPVSGAHFNPIVTAVFWQRGEIGGGDAFAYVVVQIVSAIVGVWLAHIMFDIAVLQTSTKIRTGLGQWVSEIVAAGGLVLTILGTRRTRPEAIPMAVALFIVAAYWFTASTSFANPAVALARSLSDTFAGIRPLDVPAFVIAQIIGALVGAQLYKLIIDSHR